MTAIRLERSQWAAFCSNRKSVQRGDSVPMQWSMAFDQVLRLSGFSGFQPLTYDALFSEDYQMNWLPFPAMLLWAVARPSNVIFLCWGGISGVSAARKARQRFLLSRSGRVWVNDSITGEEILTLTGRRDVRTVPYYVDPNFFKFGAPRERENFWFCNSVNDRSPNVVLDLAEAGHKIVWTVDENTFNGKFRNAHPNLILRPRVPWPELVKLYQTCRGFLMPLQDGTHPAGQTTVMEAIACGAPVIMSKGRAASIFAEVPTVQVVPDNSPEQWREALGGCRSSGTYEADTLFSVSDAQARRMSIPTLAETFGPILPST